MLINYTQKKTPFMYHFINQFMHIMRGRLSSFFNNSSCLNFGRFSFVKYTNLTVILALSLLSCAPNGSNNFEVNDVTLESNGHDIGLINNCDFQPDTVFSRNNPLIFDEDRSVKCNIRFPLNIDFAALLPSDFDIGVSVSDTELFPEGSITYDNNIPISYNTRFNPFSAPTSGSLVFSLSPAGDKFGKMDFTISIYNATNNDILGSISYPIIVNSVNDAPVFDSTSYNFRVFRNNLVSEELGRVQAIIPADNQAEGAIIYSIFTGDLAGQSANNIFIIDSNTGSITLRRELIRANKSSYTFTVISRQAGVDISSRVEVEVSIELPYRALTFSADSYSFEAISYNNVIGVEGQVIGRVQAFPVEDNNQDSFIYYSLSEDIENNIFEVDYVRGDITLTRDISKTDQGEYIFNVIASQTDFAGDKEAEVRVLIFNEATIDSDQDGYSDVYDAFPLNSNLSVQGSGTATDPYIIRNIYQLQAINGNDHTGKLLDVADSHTSGRFLYGTSVAESLASNYKLGNNIDAAVTNEWRNGDVGGFSPSIDSGFIPIGYCPILGACVGEGPDYAPFTGSLDGAGFVISDLFILHEFLVGEYRPLGLFGNIHKQSSIANGISNLGLNNVNITAAFPPNAAGVYRGGVHLGGLVGYVTGGASFEKVYVTGELNVEFGTASEPSTINVGGILGTATISDGTINTESSYTIVNINTLYGSVGGYLGSSTFGTYLLNDFYSLTNIIGDSSNARPKDFGGFIGDSENPHSITSSYAVSESDGVFPIYGLVKNIVDEFSPVASYWDARISNQNLVVYEDYINDFIPLLGTQGLSTDQLRGCSLDGVSPLAGPTVICNSISGTAIFPADDGAGNILWGNNIDTVTGEVNGWTFVDDEYPYLFARDSSNNDILPTLAEQKCQRNRFFYDLPCDNE